MSFLDPEYELEVTLTTSGGISRTFVNVHNFSVVKVPFSKLANITSVTIEGDYAFLSVISSESQSKLEPSCNVSIYTLINNETNPSDHRRGKRGPLLFSGSYFVLTPTDEQMMDELGNEFQFQNQVRIYTFTLSNSIIHWLSINHNHNVILDDVTGAGAIRSYESYLSSKFKADAFSFQNLATDINPHVYDQILSKSRSDLMTASDLLMNYKAYNSISYYYHDDFHIGAIIGNNSLMTDAVYSPKAINNITLSLGSISSLPKVDIHDANHMDGTMHTTINHVESATDQFSIFQNPASTVISTSSDGHVETILPITIGDNRPIVEKGTVTPFSMVVSTIDAKRVVHGKAVSSSSTPIIPKNHINIYGPDGIDNASARYHNSKNLITSGIKTYTDMTFQKCYPDLINLTSMYNLDDSARSRFAYLPVAITNIFHRQKSKDAKLSHSIRAKFMEFNI